MSNATNRLSFIWSVANLLRENFKQPDLRYGHPSLYGPESLGLHSWANEGSSSRRVQKRTGEGVDRKSVCIADPVPSP